MAESFEGSFSIDEFELSVLENAAELPNVDNITTCSCRGHCLREKGRNFCPCRSVNSFCSSACHGEEFGCCMNNRRVQESDSEDTDSDFSMQGNDSGSSEEGEDERGEMEEIGVRQGHGRGRGRGGQGRGGRRRGGRRRGDRGRGDRGRGDRGRGESGRGRSGRRRGDRGRGGRGRGGRGRGRQGRGRGGLIVDPNAANNQANHEQELVNLVEAMDIGALRRFAIELLRRQPAAFADVVNGELAGAGEHQPEPDPNPNLPEWCKCGHCVAMPTQLENKCCTQSIRPCISRKNLFSQLVLDGNVLELSMRYREDVLVLNNVRNNENFRHAAYRQYVLWQHGRLGRGNRRVIPSCCVIAIRARYPSPNGIYRGYMPARL